MARPKRENNGEIITTKTINFEEKIAVLSCIKAVDDYIDSLIKSNELDDFDLENLKNENDENGFYHNLAKTYDLNIIIYKSIKQQLYKMV